MAAIDQLTGLMSALNTITGSSVEQKQTTSGGKQTQQTQLSDEAVNAKIKQILAGPGGVRDIGGSAKRAGLYNATAEDILMGNLTATAAAQGELARAPTVTTSAPQTVTTKNETPGMGLLPVLGTVAGAAALNKVMDIGGDVVGSGISDLLSGLGIGGGSEGKKNSFLPDMSAFDTNLSFGDGNFGLSASAIEGPGGFSGNILGETLGFGLPGISGGGDSFSGLGGVKKQDAEGFDLLGSVGNALSGFFSGGGLGGLVGAITGGVGSSTSGAGGGGGSSGGSVICTALMEQGDLDEKLYAAGAKYLQSLNPLVRLGYQIWGVAVANKIRKGSWLASAICRPFARSRTALLASSGSFWAHLKHPLGTVTKFVGEPTCSAIGWAVVNLALYADLSVPTSVKA